MSRLWQIVVSLSVVVTLCATSFIFPVYAQTELDVLVSTNSYVQHTYQELLNLIRDVRNIGQNLGDDSSQQSIKECVNKFADFESAIQTALLATYEQTSDFGNIYYLLSDFVTITNNVKEQTSKLDALLSVSGSGASVSYSGVIVDIKNLLDDVNSNVIAINDQLNKFNKWNISIDSLPAYLFFVRYPNSAIDINASWLNYPFVLFKDFDPGSFSDTYRCFVNDNSDFVLCWIGGTFINSSRFNVYTSGIDVSSSSYSLPYGGRYINSIIVHNNSNNSGYICFSFNFGQSSGSTRIAPIWIGNGSFIPNDVKALIQYRGSSYLNYDEELDYILERLSSINSSIVSGLIDPSDNKSWLQKIFNFISGDPDSSNQVQRDIDSMNDKVSDIQDSLDNYSDQLDSNIVNINPSSLLQKVEEQGNKINFLSGIIQQVYLSFGVYAWIFLVPLVMALILLFMG